MGPVCKYDPLTNQLITLLADVRLRRTIGRKLGSIVDWERPMPRPATLTAAVATLERAAGHQWRVGPPADRRGPVSSWGILALEAGDYRQGQPVLRGNDLRRHYAGTVQPIRACWKKRSAMGNSSI